ncbi:hypothetical protein AAHB66_18990 [Leclercia sp. S52]|uniref:hypothetical protein n=1 Tax=Leclercia sp. S52 TaxID=3138178 RepID=UPI00321A3C5B
MNATHTITPRVLMLSARDWVPNHPHLPVLIYKGAILEGDHASQFEQRFADNGWPPQWRDGIFDYHHYHSTAHEVLGIARGTARLVIGGPGGRGAGGRSRGRPVIAGGNRALPFICNARFSGGGGVSAGDGVRSV